MAELPAQFLNTADARSADPALSYPGSDVLPAESGRSVTNARAFVLARTYPTDASVAQDFELDWIENLPEWRRFKGRFRGPSSHPLYAGALPQEIPVPITRLKRPKRLTKLLPAATSTYRAPMYGQAEEGAQPARTGIVSALRRRFGL